MKKNQILLLFLVAGIELSLKAASTLPNAPWKAVDYQYNDVASSASDVVAKQATTLYDNAITIGQPIANAVSLIFLATQYSLPNPNYLVPSYSSPLLYGDFLTTAWLGDFAAALTGAAQRYQGINVLKLRAPEGSDSSDILALSITDQDQKNYLTLHLAPALIELQASYQTAKPSSGPNFTMPTLPNSSAGSSFDSIIITTINNNTNATFSINQGGNQIGTLVPGVNSVALYGAANAAGDIVFTSNDATPGSFRISFKTGAEIIKIVAAINIAAAALATKNNYTAPAPVVATSVNQADSYLCVQVTAADIPSGTPPSISSIMQRTQCINVSQLKYSANITLQIEDNMTIATSDFKVIDQTTVFSNSKSDDDISDDISMAGIYYPSISQITEINGITLPILALPSSLANNLPLSTWINFINLVMGAIQTNYKKLFIPSYITEMIASNSPIFILKKDDGSSVANFGDLSKINTEAKYLSSLSPGAYMPIQWAVGGLLGTTFSGDIPDLNIFESYLNASIVK